MTTHEIDPGTATTIESFDFLRQDMLDRREGFRWLRTHDPVSWHPATWSVT